MSAGMRRWSSLHAPVAAFIAVLAMWVALDRTLHATQPLPVGLPWVLERMLWLGSAGSFATLLWLLVRESRRARRKAKLADALAHEVLDATPDGLLIVGPDGRIVHANTRLLDIAAASPVVMVGRPLAELVLRDDGGRPLAWPEDGFAKGQMGSPLAPVDVESFIKPMQGVTGYRLVHLRDVSKEHGNLRVIQNQERDLRILAELATTLNRVIGEDEILRVAVEFVSRRIEIAASGGIFVIDGERSMLRLVASFGLEPSFLASEREVPLGECLCGQVALNGETRYSASSTSDPFHSRHRASPPHGHIVMPLRAEAGLIGVLFLYLRENADLTEDFHRVLEGIASEVGLALMRVREHNALKERECALERLFEEAPDAMMVASADGAVLRVNQRGRHWFTVGETIKGRFPWDSVLSLCDEQRRAQCRATLAGDGERQTTVDITASRAAAGEVQLILRDVTREVVLEQQTRELQKMEIVGALAAGLAHNLNNIFASVLAHLFQLREIVTDSRGIDLSVRGGDFEVARRHLDAATVGAEQVSVLIERLLEFSRPRAPRLEVLDLGRRLREQIELAKPLLGPRISIHTELPFGVNVRADKSILDNALLNLLLNASHAMSTKGELYVRCGADAGEHAWFEVKDNGVGMEEEIRMRIFEPFFSTKQAGTGLGLSTLHAGITSLGGEVRVESAPGQGSTFRIALPSVAGPFSSDGGKFGAAKRRLLLAEDVPVLRAFTARHLEESGWEVRAVGSIRELKDLAGAWRPDVAVVDWNLADGNAAGAIAELRGLGSAVVVVSGDPAAVQLDGVPVVSKPVDWARLEECLRNV